MGGRKSYPTKNLLGSSKKVKESFESLKHSIANKDTKQIALDAFKVFSSSKKTINYFAYSTKLSSFIIRNFSKILLFSEVFVYRFSNTPITI